MKVKFMTVWDRLLARGYLPSTFHPIQESLKRSTPAAIWDVAESTQQTAPVDIEGVERPS